eukprot:1840893-Prymnesium_polylepis.1
MAQGQIAGRPSGGEMAQGQIAGRPSVGVVPAKWRGAHVLVSTVSKYSSYSAGLPCWFMAKRTAGSSQGERNAKADATNNSNWKPKAPVRAQGAGSNPRRRFEPQGSGSNLFTDRMNGRTAKLDDMTIAQHAAPASACCV